jgi:hypothetical protein
MQEAWNRWEPVNNLAKKYSIESITESIADKFKVILIDSDNKSKKVLIAFADGIDAHRSTNESYVLSTLTYLKSRYGSDFYTEWTFFKIENSNYLKWMSEQSYGITQDCHFTHFCILSSDSMLDIIAPYEPKITLIG